MQIWAQLRGDYFLTLDLIAEQWCPSQATPGELSLLEGTKEKPGILCHGTVKGDDVLIPEHS